MQINRVMGTAAPAFSGNKEMNQIAARYAKTAEDKKLVEMAKSAYALQLDITGDGVYIEPKEEKEAQDFFTAATNSQNGKLAFLLLNDCRKPFSMLDKLLHDTKDAMVTVARKSDDVTKTDVLDYLV